jgi:antibiotic biosynthesis monooxygenase (ABM) superfamily enzyme
VNVFTVEPGRQAALVDLLADATTAVINRFPGYVSANIHRSLDGTKVVNYAQWRRVEDDEAMLAEPSVQQHISRAAAAAISFEPHLHRVEFTDQASQGPAASPRRRSRGGGGAV